MPLRILHVTPYYEEAWAYGGIPRVAASLARELARRGHDVTVCTTDVRDERSRLTGGGAHSPRRAWAPVRRADGVTIRVFPNVSNRLAYRYQFFVPRGLSIFLREHVRDFQIAHVHGHHHLLGVLAARHSRRARLPYVVAPNGTAPRLERRRAAKWIFDATLGRHVLPHAARVLAVSDAERHQLRALGVADDRIATIPNPLALDEFTDLPPRGRFRGRLGFTSEPLVLYLGKLTPRKRLDVLIDAFSRLQRPDAQLVIAGNDMGSGASVRRHIEQRRLSDVSRLPGLLVGRDRLEALQDADVVVYPSQHEVFGLVPFEALLCGTPVVVADDSGCGEHLRRVGGGLVAPQGDVAAFTDAIARILSEPERWRAEAAAAAPRVRSSLGAGAVCDRLERVYHDVVGVGPAAGDGA